MPLLEGGLFSFHCLVFSFLFLLRSEKLFPKAWPTHWIASYPIASCPLSKIILLLRNVMQVLKVHTREMYYSQHIPDGVLAAQYGPQLLLALVAELKLKISESFFSSFQFQLCFQGVLFKFDFTFTIYGQLFKKLVLRILIDCILRDSASSIASILKWRLSFLFSFQFCYHHDPWKLYFMDNREGGTPSNMPPLSAQGSCYAFNFAHVAGQLYM